MKVRKYILLEEKIEIFKRFSQTGEKLKGNTVFEGYPIGMWAIQIRSELNRKIKGKEARIGATKEQLDMLQDLGILDRQKEARIDEKIDMLVEWRKKYPKVQIGQNIPEDTFRKYATNEEEYKKLVAEYEKIKKYYDYARNRKSENKLTQEQISRCKEGNIRGVFGFPTQVEELAKKTGQSEENIEHIIIDYETMANFINLYRKGELNDDDSKLASSMLRSLLDIDLGSDSDKTDKLYNDIIKTFPEHDILELYSSEGLEKMINTLQPREEYVLKRRYGLLSADLPTNLRDIASEMKVSGEMVRQIEHRALRKLRAPSKLKKFSINFDEIDMLTEDEREILENLKNKLYASDVIFCKVPLNALQQNSEYYEILRCFSFIKKMNAITEERRNKREQEFLENRKNNPEEARKINIQELGFSLGTRTALRKAKVKTLGDIVQFTQKDLMKKNGIGIRRFSEIMQKIEEYGLTLREETEPLHTTLRIESEVENETTDAEVFATDVVAYAKRRKELKAQEKQAAELEELYEELYEEQVSEEDHNLDDGSK